MKQKPTLDALGAVHAAGLSSFHEKNQKAHGPVLQRASFEQGPDHETCSFSALAAFWYYTVEYSTSGVLYRAKALIPRPTCKKNHLINSYKRERMWLARSAPLDQQQQVERA